MVRNQQITFRVYGMEHYKDAVDAAVFARKLSAFVKGLAKSDINGNGRRCLDFLIADLRMGSAMASIAEREGNIKYPAKVSGIEQFHSVLTTVYGGRANELSGASNLLPIVKSICKGIDKSFSHIEVTLDDDRTSTVRVDKFFVKQVQLAAEFLATETERVKRRMFKGVSFSTFDGTLKEADHRGTIKLARLVLTAGGIEIECAYNEELAPEIRRAFDQRAMVEAWAHYDGSSQLPSRLDVKSARPFKERPDLLRWKGAFGLPADGEEW